MKKRNLLLTFLSASMLLTGCDFINNIFGQKPEEPKTEEKEEQKEEEKKEEEFEHLTTNPILTGSYSGVLVELSTGKYLEVNESYGASLVTSSNLDKTLTFKSKYDAVATVEAGTTPGAFTIHTHKVGDTIIYGYDVKGVLVLRELVQVRPTIALEKMPEHLYNIDSWKSTGIFGSYTMSFVSSSPLTGTLSGHDDFEQTNITFNLVDGRLDKLFDFHYYHYDFVLDVENSQTKRTFVDFFSAVTGDQVLIYYSSGTEVSLFEFFMPVAIE